MDVGERRVEEEGKGSLSALANLQKDHCNSYIWGENFGMATVWNYQWLLNLYARKHVSGGQTGQWALVQELLMCHTIFSRAYSLYYVAASVNVH